MDRAPVGGQAKTRPERRLGKVKGTESGWGWVRWVETGNGTQRLLPSRSGSFTRVTVSVEWLCGGTTGRSEWVGRVERRQTVR